MKGEIEEFDFIIMFLEKWLIIKSENDFEWPSEALIC